MCRNTAGSAKFEAKLNTQNVFLAAHHMLMLL
jgi:hypothetical protein